MINIAYNIKNKTKKNSRSYIYHCFKHNNNNKSYTMYTVYTHKKKQERGNNLFTST